MRVCRCPDNVNLSGFPDQPFYFRPQGDSPENFRLMKVIDRYHMDHPAFGSRQIAHEFGISRGRARRLMRNMGISAISPSPRTSTPRAGHAVYPYLLRNVAITGPNHVWSTDITFIPMACGFVYLTAVIDRHSRYVLSRQPSNTLDRGFCIEALESALSGEFKPEIFNTDQGSRYTSADFTSVFLLQVVNNLEEKNSSQSRECYVFQ